MNLIAEISLLLMLFTSCWAMRNRAVTLPRSSYCNIGISSPYTTSELKIDGAIIKSSYSSSYKSCAIRFKADASSATMHVKIVTWRGGYGKYLTISSGKSGTILVATVQSKVFNKVIIVPGRYVTFHYNTPRSTSSNDFEIIITAVEPSLFCDEFKCNNGRCIEKDLKCDGVDHCFDRSDEYSCSKDITNFVTNAVKITMGAIIGIVIGVVLLCILCIVCVVVCCQKSRGRSGTVIQRNPAAVTVVTAPAGSYPAQPAPVGYPMQPGAYPVSQPAYPVAEPAYPPPQPTSPAPQYAYGQGAGYTSLSNPATDANAPPSYEKATAPPPS